MLICHIRHGQCLDPKQRRSMGLCCNSSNSLAAIVRSSSHKQLQCALTLRRHTGNSPAVQLPHTALKQQVMHVLCCPRSTSSPVSLYVHTQTDTPTINHTMRTTHIENKSDPPIYATASTLPAQLAPAMCFAMLCCTISLSCPLLRLQPCHTSGMTHAIHCCCCQRCWQETMACTARLHSVLPF
jgi:hypothetical protein